MIQRVRDMRRGEKGAIFKYRQYPAESDIVAREMAEEGGVMGAGGRSNLSRCEMPNEHREVRVLPPRRRPSGLS